MKFKKTIRQKLAVALIAAMTAGSAAFPVMAEETQKQGWVLENGDWYFYKSDGEMRRDQLWHATGGQDSGKWFAFDESGRMFCDELFVAPKRIREMEDGQEPLPDMYAYPFGNIAENKWVRLNEEGHQYDGSEDGESFWYFFDGKGESAKMVRGREQIINEKYYGFDQNGHMYSSQWGYLRNDSILEEGDEGYGNSPDGFAYYQYDGAKAIDKWLPLGSYWYRFDPNGKVSIILPMASASNAEPPVIEGIELASDSNMPGRTVESITVQGGHTVEKVMGSPVKLKFQVKLASDSNAKTQEFTSSRHDIWCKTTISDKVMWHIDDKENAIISVEYTPSLTQKETLQLCVDGIESDPITLTLKEFSDVKEQQKAAESMLDNWQKQDLKPSTVRDELLTVLSDAETEQKKELQYSILTNKNYDELASSYAFSNGISESVTVHEDVQAQLQGAKISIIGGALNADEKGSEVTLLVEQGSSEKLTQNFDKKIAFDIKLEIASAEQTDLDFPVKITMPVPVGFQAENMQLFHIHEGDDLEELDFTISDSGDSITFSVYRFSDFVFAQNNVPNEGGGGSSSGGSSSGGSGGSFGGGSGQSAGVVTTDPQKGRVHSINGIITGSGDGYSNWQQETAADGSITWKLQYADGSFAAGSMIPQADGSVQLQPAWELINGNWYAFGADGIALSGFFFDPALGGQFYIDINSGMKTGWVQIDGHWYYMNPVSDGKRGLMITDSWIDGWYVDQNGRWDGQNKQ